jgi:aminoglycoside 3-N-acetyltransferase
MKSQRQLVEELHVLGLRPSDGIVVHSSLRAVGAVQGGADAVASALVEAVGPDGLVVAPTFTYDSARFDPVRTPGRTGALSEAFRRRPDSVRSLHPFYSVAAVGQAARSLCADHELRLATGLNTPLDRLSAAGGSVLLLGVDHTSNTTAHVGEFHAAAPYLDIPFDPTWPTTGLVVHPDGTMRSYTYDRFPGCSRAFGALDEPLAEHTTVGSFGEARAILVPGRAVIAATVTLLQDDPSALLCTDPNCYRCSRARARLNAAGASIQAVEEGRAR